MSVAEQRVRQGHQESTQGAQYVREFTVDAVSAVDALTQLANVEGIVRGTPYQDEQGNFPYPFVVANDFQVTPMVAAPVDGSGLYLVRVLYTNPTRFFARPQVEPPPDGTLRYFVKQIVESQAVDYDRLGNPIVNVAGEPYDPPLTRQAVREIAVLRFTRLGADYAAVRALYLPFHMAVNSAPYLGAAAGNLLFHPAVIEELPTRFANQRVFSVTIEMPYKPTYTVRANNGTFPVPGWTDAIPQMGFRVRDPAQPLGYRELGVSKAVPLTADGTGVLPPGDLPFYVAWEHYEPMDFNAAPIP